MPWQDFQTIQLKDEYRGTLGNSDAIEADPNRTPAKDEVAAYVISNILDPGRWPIQMTDLAEETEYSRQHVSNVIGDYFVGVGEDDADGAETTPSDSGGETQAGTDRRRARAVDSDLGRGVTIHFPEPVVRHALQERELSDEVYQIFVDQVMDQAFE